jgi:hypothetical protein
VPHSVIQTKGSNQGEEMSKQGGNVRGGRETPVREPATTRGRSGAGRKWLIFGAAVLLVACTLVAAFFISEYVQSPILAQKCGRLCHSVASLTRRNLSASSAAAAVDKMVREGKVTLTQQQRTDAIGALSHK